MRSVVLCFLVAFSTWASACIFSDGFDMSNEGCIIGYGNYYYTTPTIGGSASGAAFLSSTDELFDGQPSTVTSCQWIGGTQTTASTTRIGLTINTQDGSNPEIGVVGVLNVNLPEGIPVNIYDAGTYPAPGSLIGSSLLVANTIGTNSAWVVLDQNQTVSANAIFVEFVNHVGSGHPIAAAQVFAVGEIAVFSASEWGMKRDTQFSSATTPKLRLASSGVQWPVPAPRVRTINFNLSPITQKDAFDADGTSTPIDIESLVNQIYGSSVIAVLPFLNFDPAYYGVTVSKSTPQIVSKSAYLAQVSQAPIIKANGDMYYDVNFILQESI